MKSASLSAISTCALAHMAAAVGVDARSRSFATALTILAPKSEGGFMQDERLGAGCGNDLPFAVRRP